MPLCSTLSPAMLGRHARGETDAGWESARGCVCEIFCAIVRACRLKRNVHFVVPDKHFHVTHGIDERLADMFAERFRIWACLVCFVLAFVLSIGESR